MRDIVCAGCSFTRFGLLEKHNLLDGKVDEIDGKLPLGSYPESIQRNFGNKVYNSGMAGNNIATSVLSIISTADRLLKEGNKNISVILQCTEFTRQSFYFPSSFQIRKNIAIDNTNVRNNNYLFDKSNSGFFQFGTINGVSDGFSPVPILTEIAKQYSNCIYSIESAYVNSLIHILLLQNFCKVNKIPYKIFCKTESFSVPFYPLFTINKVSVESEFKSIFIDKILTPKQPLTFINSDAYVSNLFSMLDLDNFWFLDDNSGSIKYGGITEWVYLRNEYKEGDTHYTPLTVEDIDGTPTEYKPMYPIERVKERIQQKRFEPNGHPTYYYWDLFTRSEITKWGVL